MYCVAEAADIYFGYNHKFRQPQNVEIFICLTIMCSLLTLQDSSVFYFDSGSCFSNLALNIERKNPYAACPHNLLSSARRWLSRSIPCAEKIGHFSVN